MRKSLFAAALACAALVPAYAVTALEPPEVEYSFDGVFGRFDPMQLQRGYQVYAEVCSACHSLKLIAYRNLKDPGGPGFSEPEAKALAAAALIPSLDDAGEPATRPGTLADYFPYQTQPAEQATLKGAYGIAPPDLSLMAKAREGGPSYIHAVLTGYDQTPPAGLTIPDTGNYNPYYPGGVIAMPKPLNDGQVEYAQPETEVPRTVDQYAKDVSAFLMWAAEPKMDTRKRIGFGVLVFLGVLSVLLFFSYRRVWRNVDH